jgi:hypothetical protein
MSLQSGKPSLATDHIETGQQRILRDLIFPASPSFP